MCVLARLVIPVLSYDECFDTELAEGTHVWAHWATT
jgi:hypothetical protein